MNINYIKQYNEYPLNYELKRFRPEYILLYSQFIIKQQLLINSNSNSYNNSLENSFNIIDHNELTTASNSLDNSIPILLTSVQFNLFGICRITFSDKYPYEHKYSKFSLSANFIMKLSG